MIRTLYILTCLVFLLTLSACETSTPTAGSARDPGHPVTASMPYLEPRTDLPVVYLEIEGRGTFSFIIDTGANTSAVYVGSKDVLGVEQGEEKRVIVRGLTGLDERPSGRLSGLRIGADRHDDIRVAILEPRPKPPDADGVLGTDILQNYALVFDPDLDLVQFIPAEKFDATPYMDWDRVPIARLDDRPVTRGLWFASAPVVSRYVPVLIDTGADFSVMNWNAARLKNDLEAMYQSLLQEQEIKGATGTFQPSLGIIAARFQIGGHKWGAPRFIILDLDALAPIVGEGEPLVIAGADMFATRRYAVDFTGGVIFIDPQGPHLKYEEGAPDGTPSLQIENVTDD